MSEIIGDILIAKRDLNNKLDELILGLMKQALSGSINQDALTRVLNMLGDLIRHTDGVIYKEIYK